MVTMTFNKTVKYKGTKYPANTEIEVTNADAKAFQKSGGHVVEKADAKKAEAKEAEAVEEEEAE